MKKLKSTGMFFFSLTLLWVVVVPLAASAQTKTLAPLTQIPGINTGAGVVPYLISVLTFLIGVAGVIAVIRLVICGFQLLLAPGAGQREHAKDCLGKVVLGLLLAISAFVLLRSINPALTEPKLDIPNIPSTALSGSQSTPTAPGWYYAYRAARTGDEVFSGTNADQATCQSAKTSKEGEGVEITRQCFEVTAQTPARCSSCENLTVPAKPPGQGCRAPGPCQVASALNAKLNTLQGLIGGWWVTEAHPPTRVHRNSCHQQGTCVDADYTDNRGGATNVRNFITAAQQAGLRAVYETATTAEYNALISAGVPSANLWNGEGWINGSHFSVYNN